MNRRKDIFAYTVTDESYLSCCACEIYGDEDIYNRLSCPTNGCLNRVRCDAQSLFNNTTCVPFNRLNLQKCNDCSQRKGCIILYSHNYIENMK